MTTGAYASVQVLGMKELGDAMRELPVRLARNVLRGTVAAGAADIRNEARQRAPVYHGEVSKGHPPPGTLRRSIIIKRIPERSSQWSQMYYVTVRHGKKYSKQGKEGRLSQDAYYWKWVEFGHRYVGRYKGFFADFKTRGRGRLTGLAKRRAESASMVPPHPFMRPAFEARKSAAVERMKAYLTERIPAEVEKLPRFRALW